MSAIPPSEKGMKSRSGCLRLHLCLQGKGLLRFLAIITITFFFVLLTSNMWHGKSTITINLQKEQKQLPFSNVREPRTVISPGHDVTLTRALTPEERIR